MLNRIAKSAVGGQLIVNGKPYLSGRRTGKLVGGDSGAGRQHPSADCQGACEYSSDACRMGADRIGRRKLRFQHSGPLDRGGTGPAFAPGGFVVWKLEERRLQPCTCVGEERCKTLPESRVGRRR